jgi:hypothetical protein
VYTDLIFSQLNNNMGTANTAYALSFSICKAMKDAYPVFCAYRWLSTVYVNCNAAVTEGVWSTAFYDGVSNTNAQLFATQYVNILAHNASAFVSGFLANVNIGNFATIVSASLGTGSVAEGDASATFRVRAHAARALLFLLPAAEALGQRGRRG